MTVGAPVQSSDGGDLAQELVTGKQPVAREQLPSAGQPAVSARANRFGNRRVRIFDYLGSGVYEVVDRVPAGSNEDNFPARADSFKIGSQGNGC